MSTAKAMRLVLDFVSKELQDRVCEIVASGIKASVTAAACGGLFNAHTVTVLLAKFATNRVIVTPVKVHGSALSPQPRGRHPTRYEAINFKDDYMWFQWEQGKDMADIIGSATLHAGNVHRGVRNAILGCEDAAELSATEERLLIRVSYMSLAVALSNAFDSLPTITVEDLRKTYLAALRVSPRFAERERADTVPLLAIQCAIFCLQTRHFRQACALTMQALDICMGIQVVEQMAETGYPAEQDPYITGVKWQAGHGWAMSSRVTLVLEALRNLGRSFAGVSSRIPLVARDDVMAVMERMLTIVRTVYHDSSANAGYVVDAMCQVADIRSSRSEFGKAKKLAQSALALVKTVSHDHVKRLARCLMVQARAYNNEPCPSRDELLKAAALWYQAIGVTKKAYGQQYHPDLDGAYRFLTRTLLQLDQVDEADKSICTVLALQRRHFGDVDDLAIMQTLFLVGTVRTMQGREVEAEQRTLEALGMHHRLKNVPELHSKLCHTHRVNLVETYKRSNNAAKIAALASGAVFVLPVPGLFCHACGLKPATSRCGRCHSASYCNRNCQSADWPRHKHQCKRSK